MTWTRRGTIGALGACAATPHHSWAEARKPDFSFLDKRLQQRVDAGYFPGIGIRIGRGERIIHEAYFGNGTPNQAVHVASAGKWVAVAVIASLVDAGKLRWTDQARAFIPELSDAKGEASLAQLLSHTAGYPDYQPPKARRDDYQTLEEAVRQIAVLPAVARPGERFQYGGLAMQVAGRMAELVTGKVFNDIFLERIAQPLNMTDSGFLPVSEEPGFSPMLGGAFYTSTADYGRFLAMLSQNGRHQESQILSHVAIAVMQGDHIKDARIMKDDFVAPARGVSRRDIYGLGQWREEVAPDGKPELLSSPGWAGAYGWLDRKAGVWGAVIAKANVEAAVADGYSTFLGSTLYAPMVRDALRDAADTTTKRGVINVPGAQLYYEERGRGEPLILIHGHSLDRRMWDDQFALFARHYRVIRYDLRGYGRSSLPDEDVPFLHADDLKALMEQLGIERARLIGLSLGGFIATDFLALHPQRVVKAVMAGGDLFDVPGPDEPWTPEGIAKRRVEIAQLRKGGQWAFKRRWYDRLIENAGAGRERIRRPLWAMIDEWQMWQPLHVEPRLLLGRSVRQRLANNRPKVPVLIVRGDRETAGFAITDLINGHIEMIADCGHLSNMDQPERFNAAVLAFLK